MISFEQALEILMNVELKPPKTENVDLFEASGRILAQNVIMDRDAPPFDKSAMDGYACRRDDLGNILQIVEEIPAGKVPQKKVGKNQCAKIMTGAKIPNGADCVVMVEFTNNPSKDAVQFTGNDTENNICYQGEDLKKGDAVLKKGALIKPQDVAVLATVGCAKPLVAQRPRVGIIATGDELVEPEENPGETQIRNSNGYQLFSQAKNMGAEPICFGIAKDVTQSLDEKILKAKEACDVLILTGGVSMGDFDLVPEILAKNGFEMLFHRVGIKPGRPTLFGVSENSFCFGLPGNPVSAFLTFEMFAKPFLFKMMEREYKPIVTSMIFEETIRRKKTDRRAFLPVKITNSGGVITVPYHGSAHLNALCEADGIMTIAEGVSEIKKGESIHVRQI